MCRHLLSLKSAYIYSHACIHILEGTRNAPKNVQGKKSCCRSSSQKMERNLNKKEWICISTVLSRSSIKGNSGIKSPPDVTAYHEVEKVKF